MKEFKPPTGLQALNCRCGEAIGPECAEASVALNLVNHLLVLVVLEGEKAHLIGAASVIR